MIIHFLVYNKLIGNDIGKNVASGINVCKIFFYWGGGDRLAKFSI